MVDFNFDNLVGLLTKVTKDKKLEWRSESDGSFNTIVGKCPISISTSYDPTVNIDEYTISLSNANGEVFYSETYNDSSQQYVKLDRLYQVIRDSILHITESENDIMTSLESLNRQQSVDELPF